MTGEGSDELAQGYLYFHHQPKPEDGDKDSRFIRLACRGDRSLNILTSSPFLLQKSLTPAPFLFLF